MSATALIVPSFCTGTCSNGMPLLIHMTFKDKGSFARHHMLSLASWARENPDHAILMYDDADLEAYIRCGTMSSQKEPSICVQAVEVQ